MPTFSIPTGFLYKVNWIIYCGTEFIMQSESTILAFTFAVSTFLSSIENGSNSTASDVFVMFNVGGLHNPDKISDN